MKALLCALFALIAGSAEAQQVFQVGVPQINGLSPVFTAYGSGKGAWQTGNQTPVAGAAMQVDNQLQVATTNTLTAEAGIFPGANSYAFVGINKEFNALGPAGGAAPFTGLFSLVTNNNSGADVVSVFGDAIAQGATDAVWGANFLVRNKVNGAKLVGAEIDIAAAAGTTLSSSGGALFINAFNIATGIPAISVGGVSGGTFSNGLVLSALTGAGVTTSGGATMASLINAQNGTYSTDAFVLGNTQAVRFLTGGSAPDNRLTNDSAGSWQFSGGNASLSVNGVTGGASDGYSSFILRVNGTEMGLYFADNHTDPTLPVAGTAIGTEVGFPFFIVGDSGAVMAEFNGGTGVMAFGGTIAGSASFQVNTVASSVNYTQADGATTGNAPLFSFRGETNVNGNYGTNGTGGHNFFTGGPSYVEQVQILHTASATRQLTLTGSNGANPTISTTAGGISIGSGGGITTAFTDSAPTMASIASSAAALDAVCWNAVGGVLTHNGAGALCSASLEELKDVIAAITPAEALAEIAQLRPFWGKFKDSVTTTSDHRISPMLGAHAVEAIDSRLAEYTSDGDLHGVRYTNLTALFAAAIQGQQAQIEALRSRIGR